MSESPISGHATEAVAEAHAKRTKTGAKAQKISIEQHSISGTLWFGGWLFTIGFRHRAMKYAPGISPGTYLVNAWPGWYTFGRYSWYTFSAR